MAIMGCYMEGCIMQLEQDGIVGACWECTGNINYDSLVGYSCYCGIYRTWEAGDRGRDGESRWERGLDGGLGGRTNG